MELLQLRYFCDAAETENFSQTAQKFQVPPSDVSQSVKRLETELFVRLFDRKANRILLNEQGKAFYRKTKDALLLLEDARAEITDSEERGVIRMFVQTNRRTVMQTVRAFRQTHPEVDVIATHSGYSDLKDFHLIVSDDALALSGLQREKLLAEDICLAVSRKNPLAERPKVTAEDLQTVPFISMDPGNSMYRITMDICDRWGFVPHIAIQSDDPYYIRKCVELDLGVALIPAVSWKGQFSEDIALKKIDPFQRNTYVYWDDKRYIPACARAFMKVLVQAFAEEAAETGI